MTRDQVKQFVVRQLEAFDYSPPSPDGLLGVPWSRERMSREVEVLRNALVEPELIEVELADDPSARSKRPMWALTSPDPNGYIVVLDPGSDRFGLAVTGGAGPPETVAVWGDLVTTYAAR